MDSTWHSFIHSFHVYDIVFQESGVVGIIILERCRVGPETESGNRNAFRLGNSGCECVTGACTHVMCVCEREILTNCFGYVV